jgi:hypothetical protein
MDADEKKLGGGSGGDEEAPPHSDSKYVEGAFARRANGWIELITLPVADGTAQSMVVAAGDKGAAILQGGQRVNLISGLLAGEKMPALDNPGVTVFTMDKAGVIRLQLGYFEDPNCFSVTLDKGGVTINAGETGSIFLRAGVHEDGSAESMIQISPFGIVMKGTLTQIN